MHEIQFFVVRISMLYICLGLFSPYSGITGRKLQKCIRVIFVSLFYVFLKQCSREKKEIKVDFISSALLPNLLMTQYFERNAYIMIIFLLVRSWGILLKVAIYFLYYSKGVTQNCNHFEKFKTVTLNYL